MNIHAGCFEWVRTGSVTVENTQSWHDQILRADLRKRIPMTYTCCYIDNLFEDVDDHDTCDWKNQLDPVWEYRSDSRINV